MSAAVISLMLAVGVAAWVYSKFMNSTGNNTQSAATAAGVTGVIAFIVSMIILSMIF